MKLKVFTKQAVLLAVVFLASFAWSQKSFAQTCGVDSTVAGFEVDGNMKANNNLPILGDDWWSGPGGTHVGIIGSSAATSKPPGESADDFKNAVGAGPDNGGANRPYVQTMSELIPVGTIINGYEMIDAVAARDWTAPDSTTFSGNGIKNGNDPRLWTLSSGSVLGKDDIIDIGGHLRRRVSDQQLYGFFFATLLTTNGDSHDDFEIFRTEASMAPGATHPSNTGPDSTDGHSAYFFNTLTGAITNPGDILLAVDYSKGGDSVTGSVRIWCNPNNLNHNGMTIAQYNALGAGIIKFKNPVVFDGTNTHGYGYAEVEPLDPFTGQCLITTIENAAIVPGTPWGNLYGSGADTSSNLTVRQNIEVSINFSGYGIDVNPNASVCDRLFGSLVVKSRSSGSFTSTLKDYSGPFTFGNKTQIIAAIDPHATVLTCTTPCLTLFATGTAGANLSWSPGGATTHSIQVCNPGTYTVTATNDNGCSGSASAVITANKVPPTVDAGTDKILTCTTTSVTLTANASGGSTVVWSPGGQTSTSINVSATGTYIVTATRTDNGCTDKDTVVVTRDSNTPTVNITGNAVLTCTTTSITLNSNPSPGATVVWNPGGQTTNTKTVTAPGTYSVVATIASSGCTSSDVVVVTRDISGPSVNITGNVLLTCNTTSINLNSNPSGGATVVWSPGGQVTNSISVSTPGTYSVVATKTSTGCTIGASVVVAQDTSKPAADAGGDAVINCSNGLQTNLSGAPIPAGVTYSWNAIQGGHIVSGGNTASPLVDAGGCYVLTVTKTSNGCVKRDTACVTANLNRPSCCIQQPTALPGCGTTNNIINSCSTGATDYKWTVTSPNNDWTIVSGDLTAALTYNAGTGVATFKLVVSATGTGCEDSCEFQLGCPGDVSCTYTQGAYGNPGGRHCDGQVTIPFMTQALATPLTIGRTSTGNYITFTSADVLCLIGRLPGGKMSKVLNGTGTCTNLNNIVHTNKQGRFENILLAQTITLGLNLRIPSNNLGGLVITGKYVSTYGSSGTCANGVPVPGSLSTFIFPQDVLDYLKNALGHDPTIQDVYDLANDALGGVYVKTGNNPSLSDINDAVSSINEGFDECRIFSGTSPFPPTQTNPIDYAKTSGTVDGDAFGALSVSSFPNPFNSKTTIEVNADASYDNVTVELYTMTGEKVSVLYNNAVEAGQTYKMEVDGSNMKAGIYMYRIAAGDDSHYGKIVLIK